MGRKMICQRPVGISPGREAQLMKACIMVTVNLTEGWADDEASVERLGFGFK